MGSVYRARHVDIGRLFAVKVLHRTLIENPKVVARFRREAELAGRLRHENVVSVVDMGITDDGKQYLVMEYAPGRSLGSMLEDGPMPEARVLGLARQLCDGLQHAHDNDLIHRDFKPDNVIVEQLAGGRELARIVDFGVAILREDAGSVEGGRLTTKGVVVGTPHYMAPEQARGDALDHRVDLFALGLTLFELFSGKAPFDGSGVDVARANVHHATPLMGVRAPGVKVDPVLEALVRKLLSKQPADRLPSAKAVRELLDLYSRDRAAAAKLLDVRERVLESGGLPPLQQLAAGRSRGAAPSSTPYAHLVEHPKPAPPRPVDVKLRDLPLTEMKLPPDRRPLVIGGLVAAALFCAGLVVALRSEPRTPAQVANAPERPELGANRNERPPPVAPPPTDIVTANEQQVDVADAPKPRQPHQRAAPRTTPKQKPQPRAKDPPTAKQVADLYTDIGRELSAAARRDPTLTTDLWPRYRWIHVQEAMKDPVKRTGAVLILERLRADLTATIRDRGSAVD